jgi:hypothetical protein
LFQRRDVVVLLVYSLLALVLTYPLLLHLDTHVPGHGIDDPALTWNLWWVKFSIFNLGASPLYTDYLYYPLGVNLVAYTSTFLNGILSLPLQFTFGVIPANNLVIYFALVAGGYGTFLLAREILSRCQIHSDLAAALAGGFYAFGAWHINYVVAGHFMLLSNEWIPFYALYLIRLDKSSRRYGALAGLFFVLTAWTELTFIPFIALLTALSLLGFFVFRRFDGFGRLVRNLSVLSITVAVGTSPLLISLLGDFARYGYYLAPGLGRVQVFSAEPISFLIPSAAHPILGEWANALTNANTSYAFVGYAALLLAAFGLISRRRSREAWFWAVVAAFFALVLLGPTLILGGESTGIPLPFAALRAIPLVNANRYPVRYNAMLMLALTPLIALGAAALLRSRRTLVLMALTALLAFEQLVLPVPLTDLRSPPVFQTIRAEPGDFTMLDLPLGWRNSVAIQGKIDYVAEFFQTVYQKRLIGGLTSRNPAFKFQYYLEQPVLNSLVALETGREVDEVRQAQDKAASDDVLRFFNIRYVEVNRALTDPRVLQYALDVLPLKEIYRDDARLVYQVAQMPPPLRDIDLRDETARLYFDDSWGRIQASGGAAYRWATREEAHLWLPLARADHQITVRLRGVRGGQKISVRANGQMLTTLTLMEDWGEYTIPVPSTTVQDGLTECVFSAQTASSSAVREDDYVIGDTGVVSPVDIAVTSAGFDAGRFGEILVSGQNVVTGERGYHLVALDARTGRVDQAAYFDTFAGADESTKLARFVQELPAGEIVAGVAIDDVSRNLQAPAIDALRTLGVEGDLSYQFRAGHAFIGVKGVQPGQAVERVDGRFPANVAVGKNTAGDRVAFALGGISIK